MKKAVQSNIDTEALQVIKSLRSFNGTQNEFWEAYTKALLNLSWGKAGLIAIKDSKGEWRMLADAYNGFAKTENGQKTKHLHVFVQQLNSEASFTESNGDLYISIPLVFNEGVCCKFVGCFPCDAGKHAELAEVLKKKFSTVDDFYLDYSKRMVAEESLHSAEQMTSIFDCIRIVGEQDKFKTAALSFVAELANRHKAERVCLGWLKHDYIQLKAVNNTDHFEKKMQIVRDLENAMEESYEQDSPIFYPNANLSTTTNRAHEAYAKAYNVLNMLSVPIRNKDDAIAIVTLERTGAPFTDAEATQIHIEANLVSPHLQELYRRSSWFGARIARSMRKTLGKLLGHEHTWAKFFGILGIAFVLFATLYPLNYKVNSPAILKTDKIIYHTAPFSGYIDSVFVKPGDVVYKGQELLRLDQKELKLEEADLMAVEQDNRREIQKAQANHQLAEMRIHQAKLAQTQSKLKIVRYKISKASIYATADSAVIVEGDLQKRLGAYVEQGSELFQTALIENIYVEVDVSELEIKNVALGSEGLLAIKSRPDYVYRFRTERISPTASVKEQENTFAVRGEFTRQTPSWFRPGMTGIAKIFAGKNTLWWILSHQAIDFIRLKLWW
ncbi:MAG: efflux RND transporter periplasmic adaptor subunit [Fibrobacter sp.]|nr:efflux RND transporter periplasmic adaptor subunit [Fibrobacter sp.]